MRCGAATCLSAGVWCVPLLLGGLGLGFAAGPLAVAWPWVAAFWGEGILVAWGWRLRRAVLPLIAVLGVVLGARTEAARRAALAALDGARGPGVPVADWRVDGAVVSRPLADGRVRWGFLSHAGPLPFWVIVAVPPGTRVPHVGETVRVRGYLARRARLRRFERRLFLGETFEGVVAPASAGARARAALADACAAHSARGLDWCADWAALNRAMLLGERTALPHRQREIFTTAGTIHVFAISGLHVMLVALVLAGVLRAAGVPLRVRGFAVLPLLAAYVLLTGARPSAVRAGVMAAFYLVAPAFGRPGDALAAWRATALGVYACAPEHLFNAGCTLSFAVMLGLVVWLRWGQPLLPARAQRLPWCLFPPTCAAWVAGVPAAAAFFGRISFGGLLANVLAIHLAALTVALGLAGMVAGWVLPPVAIVCNNLAALSTGLLAGISALVARLPGASVTVVPWTVWQCLAWYAAWGGALALAYGVHNRTRGVWWRK